MRNPHVTIKMTAYQARLLWRAAAATMEHHDAVEIMFPSRSQRDRAYKGYEALVLAKCQYVGNKDTVLPDMYLPLKET